MSTKRSTNSKRNETSPRARRTELLRHSYKGKNFSIRVEPTLSAPAVAITVGIPLRVNPWGLRALRCHEAPVDVKNFDTTVLAYATFTDLRSKLDGIMSVKNKVSHICCGSHNSEFIITAICDKSITSIRKCTGTILRGLRFDNQFARYSALCRSLEIKPSKEAFHFAVSEANKALKQGISIVFSGRAQLKDEDLSKMAEVLSKKLIFYPTKDRGQARELDPIRGPEEHGSLASYNKITIGSLGATLLCDYLKTRISSTDDWIYDGKVLWYPKKSERRILAFGDENKIARYATQLIKKLGPDIKASIIYFMARHCLSGTANLSISSPPSLIESSLIESSIASSLQKAPSSRDKTLEARYK